MKKGLFVNLAVTLVSIFFVFLAAEIIMRFAWQMGGWVERPIYQRSFNPYLRYELVPGAKAGNISINQDGFRGPNYSIPKPVNTFRIIMLGDSETLSYLLPENEALAAQLESVLNQKSKNLRYEVLNFGVEGYTTLQELEMLKTKGLKYDPDLIIVNYCMNDPEPGEYYFNKTFFMRHSALVRYFTFRFKKTMIKRERKRLHIVNEIENYYYYHQPKYFNLVTKAFQEIAQIAKERAGRKVVVVIFPVSSIAVKDFQEDYPYWPLHKKLKSILSDNILFVDLIDEFNRLKLAPQDVAINYAVDESHKNAGALKVSAEYLYHILKNNRLILE